MPAPTSPASPGGVAARRVDGSMSLLVDLMAHAEDPAYADRAATQRRAHRAPSPRPRRRVLAAALALVLVGVATGVAVAAVRRDDGDDSRERLVAEVRRRTAESDALAAQALALRADVAARRDASLTSGDAARLRELELATATTPVQGPGVVATLDDAPADQVDPAVSRGGQVGTGRVLDRDLQGLVNGLWAAGAEAISINGLRLTARTAIRSAGEAILVDFRPLSPPYVVRAIGDPGHLEPDFVDGAAGQRLATYTSLYGLRFELHDEGSLLLPAGTVAEPRSAVPVPS